MNIFYKLKLKLFPPKKYYFIATVRRVKSKTDNGREYDTEDVRTWGFYKSKKRAIRAVTENWTDMNESGYYPWAVIGTYNEGLISQCYEEPELWFEENYRQLSEDELIEIEKNAPDRFKKDCTINKKTGRVQWHYADGWHDNFEGYKPCEMPSWAKGFCGWAL